MVSCRQQATGRAAAALLLATLLLGLPAVCCGELQQQYIKGQVLSAATGAPIPGATITTTTGLSKTTQSGSFSLRVPPNVYDLIVSAPGYRSNMATGIFAGPGQTVTVIVHLAPASTRPGTLGGKVIASDTSDGLSGALVFTDLGAIAVTDDNGYFTAVGPSGTATVTVAARGYSAKTFKNISITASGLRTITARLTKYISGLTGPVLGAVRDACTGKQLAGVSLSTSSGDYFKTTDSAKYRISTPPGTTALLACGEGYQCGLQTATRFLLPFGATVNFSLTPLERGIGSVTGIVTDNETGQSVAGARIATDTQDITFSNQAGEYALYASPCASRMTVTARGYRPAAAGVVIPAGGATAQDVVLEPLTGCIVAGTVKSFFTGLPVAGARVAALNGALATSDETGAYSLELPSCRGLITASADGFFAGRRLASSGTGAAVISLDFTLIPCLFCRIDAAAEAGIPATHTQNQ